MLGIVGEQTEGLSQPVKKPGLDGEEGIDKTDSGMDDDSPLELNDNSQPGLIIEEELSPDTLTDTLTDNQHSSHPDEDESDDEAVINRKPIKKRPVIFDDDEDSCDVNSETTKSTLEKKLTTDEALSMITEDNNEESMEDSDEDDGLSTALVSKKKSRIKKGSFLGDDADDDGVKTPGAGTEDNVKQGKMTYDSNIFDAETDSEDGSNHSDDSRSGDEGYEESDSENHPISDKLKARLKKGATKKPSTRDRKKAEKQNVQDIHSETQRIVRESQVNIPYHQPKPKSLKDFLSSAAEKRASLRDLRGAAGFRSTAWYEEKEKQKEKQRKEEKERQKSIDSLAKKTEEQPKEPEEQPKEPEEQPKEQEEQPKEPEEQENTIVQPPSQSEPPTIAVNNVDRTGEPVCPMEEDFDTLPDLVVEIDTNNAKLNAETVHCSVTVSPIDDLPDLDSNCSNMVNKETNAETVTKDSDSKLLSESESVNIVNNTESLNTSGIQLFEDPEEGVFASVISPDKCMNIKTSNQENTNPCVEDVDFTKSNLDNIQTTPVLGLSNKSSSLTPKLMALSTLNFDSLTPKLSGSPDMVISLDDKDQTTPHNPGVVKLMSRFLQHSKKKKPSQSKDHSICVVQKEKGDGDKDELKLSTLVYHSEQPEESLSQNTQPGGKLVALKEQLSVQMRLKREEARQKRVELYQLDNEEGYNEGGSDVEEEAEMTDGSDTESEDGEYKPGNKISGAEEDEENPFIDEEAEDDEEDNEIEDDDDVAAAADDINNDGDIESDDDDDNQSLKLALSDEDESKDKGDDEEDEDIIKPAQKKKKRGILTFSDDEESKDAQEVLVSEKLLQTDTAEHEKMDVSFGSDSMTPFTKHISMSTQPESYSCKKAMRPLSLPIEDSQDLYSNSVGDDSTSQSFIPATQSEHLFLSDDTQSQMLDADGFLKVNSTVKKPKHKPVSLLKASEEDSTMDELLGLCSGRFTDPASNTGVDRGASRSLFSQIEIEDDNAQTGGMDELLGLCSGKFTDSTQQIPSSKKGTIKRRPVADDVDIDAESESSFKFLSDTEEDNKENFDKDELATDEEDEEADEDSILMPAPKFNGFTDSKKGKIRQEFVDDEAELSGSEYDSDENLDLPEEEDIMMAEEGDKDIGLSEEELRNQVGRVHMKKLMDEDQHEMRRLQEMFLPDGDLHSDGKGRMRRFKWSNVDEDTQGDMFGGGSDEEGPGEDDGEESKWRMERHEREKWLQQQQENEEEENSNSQFVKLGKLILKQRNKSDSEPLASSDGNTETTKSAFVPPKPVLPQTRMSQKRGSFLSRGKDKLAKIAELTKTGVNTNAARTSKNFVFKPLSPESQSKKSNMKPAIKRPNMGTPSGSQPPNAKRQKIVAGKSFSQNSIFKLLH